MGGWFVADQALTRELEVFGAQAPSNDEVSAAQGDQEAGTQLFTVSRLLVAGVVLIIVTSLAVHQRRRRDLSQPRSVTFEARQD